MRNGMKFLMGASALLIGAGVALQAQSTNPRECAKKAREAYKTEVQACKEKKGTDRRTCVKDAREKLNAARGVCKEANQARIQKVRSCKLEALKSYESGIGSCTSVTDYRAKAKCHHDLWLKKRRAVATCHGNNRRLCYVDARMKRSDAVSACWKIENKKEARACRKAAQTAYKSDRTACRK